MTLYLTLTPILDTAKVGLFNTEYIDPRVVPHVSNAPIQVTSSAKRPKESKKNRLQRFSLATIISSKEDVPLKCLHDLKNKRWRVDTQGHVQSFQTLFKRRPVWSRRHLEMNMLFKDRTHLLKDMVPYFGFYYNR